MKKEVTQKYSSCVVGSEFYAQHYSLVSKVFSNLSIVPANKDKQRRKISHCGSYEIRNDEPN